MEPQCSAIMGGSFEKLITSFSHSFHLVLSFFFICMIFIHIGMKLRNSSCKIGILRPYFICRNSYRNCANFAMNSFVFGRWISLQNVNMKFYVRLFTQVKFVTNKFMAEINHFLGEKINKQRLLIF